MTSKKRDKTSEHKNGFAVVISPDAAAGLIELAETMAEALGIETADGLARRFGLGATWRGLCGLRAIHLQLEAGKSARLGVAAYLNHWYWRYRRISEREYAVGMSEEEVKRHMDGSAMWDDPPPGWGYAKLILYSRGYLNAESVQLGNAAETIRAALTQLGYLPSEEPDGEPEPFKSRAGPIVETIKAEEREGADA